MFKFYSLNFRFRGHYQNCHIDWISAGALRQINFTLKFVYELTNKRVSELSIVTDVESIEIAHGLSLNSSIYKCKWCKKKAKLLFAELKFFPKIYMLHHSLFNLFSFDAGHWKWSTRCHCVCTYGVRRAVDAEFAIHEHWIILNVQLMFLCTQPNNLFMFNNTFPNLPHYLNKCLCACCCCCCCYCWQTPKPNQMSQSPHKPFCGVKSKKLGIILPT